VVAQWFLVGGASRIAGAWVAQAMRLVLSRSLATTQGRFGYWVAATSSVECPDSAGGFALTCLV
jgi:hypothetical protein